MHVQVYSILLFIKCEYNEYNENKKMAIFFIMLKKKRIAFRVCINDREKIRSKILMFL